MVTAALSFLLLVLYASTFPIKSSVRYPGVVVPINGFAEVVSQVGGTVDSVLVREGDSVEVGMVVARITRDAEGVGEVSSLSRQLRDATLKSDTVKVELDALQDQAFRKTETAKMRQKSLWREVQDLGTALKLQSDRIALFQKEVSLYEELQLQGFYSAMVVNAKRSELIGHIQRQEELKRSLASTRSEAELITTEISELAAEQRRNRQILLRSDLTIRQEIEALGASKSVEIRAHRTGKVAGVTVSAGRSITSGTIMLSILPFDETVEVELLAAASREVRLSPGMSVQVRYDALPYRRYGVFKGSITSVSVIPTSQIQAPSSAVLGVLYRESSPAYRVRVAISDQIVSTSGTPIVISPGMLLEASVVTEERPLLAIAYDHIRRVFE
jgi:membrane fusion protein